LTVVVSHKTVNAFAAVKSRVGLIAFDGWPGFDGAAPGLRTQRDRLPGVGGSRRAACERATLLTCIYASVIGRGLAIDARVQASRLVESETNRHLLAVTGRNGDD
jgi:hypothetical protein